MANDLVKDIIEMQNKMADVKFGYVSPDDIDFIRNLNKKTVPTEIVGTTEPLKTEAAEYVVTKDPNFVCPEQVLDSYKEYEIPHNHNDKPFPWVDKPIQTLEEWISATKDMVGKELPQDRAIRHDQDKPHMDLLSPIAMFGLAQVMTHGLKKYPGSQWKKGMAWSKVTASLLRHTFKFMAGEDLDEETKLPHVDHMAANIMFLQEYYRKHKDLDDRIKTGLE